MFRVKSAPTSKKSSLVKERYSMIGRDYVASNTQTRNINIEMSS